MKGKKSAPKKASKSAKKTSAKKAVTPAKKSTLKKVSTPAKKRSLKKVAAPAKKSTAKKASAPVKKAVSKKVATNASKRSVKKSSIPAKKSAAKKAAPAKKIQAPDLKGLLDAPFWLEAFQNNMNIYLELSDENPFKADIVDEMEDCLKQALKLDPNHVPALILLAAFRLDFNEKLNEAMKALQKAEKLDPGNKKVRTLMQRYEKAINTPNTPATKKNAPKKAATPAKKSAAKKRADTGEEE